jgi:hypothetical protein
VAAGLSAQLIMRFIIVNIDFTMGCILLFGTDSSAPKHLTMTRNLTMLLTEMGSRIMSDCLS